MHWVGIILGGIILIANILLYYVGKDLNLFLFVFGISVIVIVLPFVIGLNLETRKEKEIDEMFLEFSRNLAESVATGTPISKSILNLKKNNYGPMSPNVEKLANQLQLGVPIHTALETFARDIGSPVINRAVELIGEAERAGGEIDYIVESVAKSIAEVEKLKKERKSAINSLVVQGYIIFFIFIGIMLVMEYKILPLATGLGSIGGSLGAIGSSELLPSGQSTSGGAIDPGAISSSFLALLLVQGLFAGLVIGKLTEGSIRPGIKHSFILAATAFLVSTGARLFLGAPG